MLIVCLLLPVLYISLRYLTSPPPPPGRPQSAHGLMTSAHSLVTSAQSQSTSGGEDSLGMRQGVCSKGPPPWTPTQALAELPRFLSVYQRRPGENKWGTPLMHQFALWCIVRALRPRVIVESGVMRGLGTWLLRQAAPEATLVLLDPRTTLQLIYTDPHPDTRYYTGHDFRDLSTLRDLDPAVTLAFVDDHYTPLVRLRHARRANISHVVFDDNYWLGFADCLSLKQGCACVLGQPECARIRYRDAWGRTSRPLHPEDLSALSDAFSRLSVYAEFPSIWRLLGGGSVAEGSSNYLINRTDGPTLLKELGLTRLPPATQTGGHYTYCNIAYTRLRLEPDSG